MAKKQQSPRITDSTHLGSIFVKEENTFVHSYELHRSDAYDTTFIKYAEGNLWDKEIQGSTAGSVYDNGDEVVISIGSTTIQLDYAEMEVLTALIMACNDTEMEFRQYIVSSSIKPMK
jgi:hypothetical protein